MRFALIFSKYCKEDDIYHFTDRLNVSNTISII